MTERIWLKHYPQDVPADIDPTQYPSLVALIEDSFKQYADRTAYSVMGKDVSYAETDAQSRAPGAGVADSPPWRGFAHRPRRS